MPKERSFKRSESRLKECDMPNFVKRIFITILCWYYEDYKRRQKKKRAEKVEQLLKNIASPCNITPFWERASPATRTKVLRQLPRLLRKQAEECSKNLPHAIKNVRICGHPVSAEEERELHETALRKAPNTDQKLHVAKLLYSNSLPLSIVLELLTQTKEWKDSLFWRDSRRKEMEALLREIDTDDEEAVQAFLEVIASQGRYRQLQDSCDYLERPIPRDILRTCFHAHLRRKSWTYRDVTDMCIQLKDWHEADRLIRIMQKDRKLRSFAGEIALAIYFDRQQQKTAAAD